MKSVNLFLVVVLASTMFSTCPANAEGLVGNVKVDAIHDGASVELKDKENQEEPVIQPQSAQMELAPPNWIKGRVFSNDDMFMYSFYKIHPFKKEWRWAIPQKSTSVGLRPSVVQYWKGYKPEGKCQVTCVPMGEGKFKFYHPTRADGPHGYMERVGVTKNGFPRYRFWFDEDPNASTQSEGK